MLNRSNRTLQNLVHTFRSSCLRSRIILLCSVSKTSSAAYALHGQCFVFCRKRTSPSTASPTCKSTMNSVLRGNNSSLCRVEQYSLPEWCIRNKSFKRKQFNFYPKSINFNFVTRNCSLQQCNMFKRTHLINFRMHQNAAVN